MVVPQRSPNPFKSVHLRCCHLKLQEIPNLVWLVIYKEASLNKLKSKWDSEIL